jgi:hypothetical protein
MESGNPTVLRMAASGGPPLTDREPTRTTMSILQLLAQ